MQTTKKKKVEVNTELESWKWFDLFDKRFFTEVWKKNRRVVRAAVILVILFYFFSFGIVPTESMSPTLEVDNFVLYRNTEDVKRGDIIFFKYPFDEKLKYVKRIIGVAGDEIEVKDQKVLVNGKVLDEDYILEPAYYTFKKTVVPKDYYFVLGDNRNNSDDSSHWGFLKKESVHGKAIAIVLPFSKFKIF